VAPQVSTFPEPLLEAAWQLPLQQLPQDVLLALLAAMAAAGVRDAPLLDGVVEALHDILNAQVVLAEVLVQQLKHLAQQAGPQEAGAAQGRGRQRGKQGGSRSRAAGYAEQVASLQRETDQQGGGRRLGAPAGRAGAGRGPHQQAQQQGGGGEGGPQEPDAPPMPMSALMRGGTTMLDVVGNSGGLQLPPAASLNAAHPHPHPPPCLGA
jgi:hypothetical protein